MAALDTQGLGNQGEMIRQLTPHDRTLRELQQYLQACIKGHVLPDIYQLGQKIIEFRACNGLEDELEEIVYQINQVDLVSMPSTFSANFLQRIQDADILSKAPAPRVPTSYERYLGWRVAIVILFLFVAAIIAIVKNGIP